MDRELVIVLDFGGQYNQLVARRVRECNVYCEIYSYKTDIEKIKAMNPKVRTAVMRRILRHMQRNYLKWVFRCSDFAMVHS